MTKHHNHNTSDHEQYPPHLQHFLIVDKHGGHITLSYAEALVLFAWLRDNLGYAMSCGEWKQPPPQA